MLRGNIPSLQKQDLLRHVSEARLGGTDLPVELQGFFLPSGRFMEKRQLVVQAEKFFTRQPALQAGASKNLFRSVKITLVPMTDPFEGQAVDLPPRIDG